MIFFSGRLWLKSKAIVPMILVLACGIGQAHAQKKKKNIFDQISDKIDNFKENTNNTVNSAKKLGDKLDNISDVGLLSTEEFDKKVTLAKGTKGNKVNIPDGVDDDKITHLQYGSGKFKNINWVPVSFFDKQLFPSAIISMDNYISNQVSSGEHPPKKLKAVSQPLGFTITSSHANIPIKWEIECAGKKYFPKLSGTAFYGNANSILELMPDIAWDHDALAKQISSTPVSIIYRIIDEKGNKEEQTVKLLLRSVNDCIYQYTDLNLDFLFIAYIQEDHPEIDNILREAMNTKMVKSFDKGNEEETNMQVAAIWRVLHERDFRYSSITNTVAKSDSFSNQSVRPFEKAIKTNQGNCVDGTVVMASILKKIGIPTIMVLTPGHCFLGYKPMRGGTKIKYVETTLLSDDNYLAKAKTPAEKKAAYKKEFDMAVKIATEEYAASKEKNDAHRISVDDLRDQVKPLPFATN